MSQSSNTTRLQASASFIVENLPAKILKCEYAVRGEIVRKAAQLDKNLLQHPELYPFKVTLPANIGNPQAVGQKPVSFHRQVLAVVACPDLLKMDNKPFPSDVYERAARYLAGIGSAGAYSHSKGALVFRQDIAAWLTARDSSYTDPESIFLTDGVSPAVATILEMLVSEAHDGVLIPIPQYPLYSATITKLGGTAVNYHLQEEKCWGIDQKVLQDVVTKARGSGIKPRVFVLINPGNPTGTVLCREDIEMVCKFCASEKLLLLADEVYQENVYTEKPFISCRKVAAELELNELQIVTFHSASKGLHGECGIRGGFMQVEHVDEDTMAQLYKLRSMALCSNTLGQALMASLVTPLHPSEPSSPLLRQQLNEIYQSLQRKAKMVFEKLNQLPDVQCQRVEGAMYAFPRIWLPPKAVELAQQKGIKADMLYCQELLEKTGLVTVPGSGFGQMEGTWHFRMTILLEEETMRATMDSIAQFHSAFLKQFA